MAVRTIIARECNPVRDEALAAAALSPGHILEFDSNAKVKKHATAGGTVAPCIVALEDELQGNSVSDAYSTGDRVFFAYLHSGDRAYVYLASGENVVIGDRLESKGDGTLRKQVTDSTASSAPQRIAFIAKEAEDLSASAAVATRILVERV